jgi:hypothetical protein
MTGTTFSLLNLMAAPVSCSPAGPLAPMGQMAERWSFRLGQRTRLASRIFSNAITASGTLV